MNLGQLKQHIESFPKGTLFNYSLSEPFAWRGVYAEVAFSIEPDKCTREELLDRINKALTDTFRGYKGGEYQYNQHTDVHFEQDYGSWTSGGYVEKWIAQLTDDEPAISAEHRLAKLAFKA